MDELEKELDEFLAGDDGRNEINWCDYADQLEKVTTKKYFRESITRHDLDALIRQFAKSYAAFRKMEGITQHVLKTSDVQKIRSGLISATLETIANYEAFDEVVIKHIDELPSKVRSATAKKGGMQLKPDALQKLILGMVKVKPKLSVSELKRLLEAEIGMGTIEDISEAVISFAEEGKPLIDCPISGLKHRLSRAKKSILKENKSR